MYPNRRGIQKGVWFLKKREKKLALSFFHAESFFLFFLTEIWFFYESYLQYAEYSIFQHYLSLHTDDMSLLNGAPHISQRDE